MISMEKLFFFLEKRLKTRTIQWIGHLFHPELDRIWNVALPTVSLLTLLFKWIFKLQFKYQVK